MQFSTVASMPWEVHPGLLGSKGWIFLVIYNNFINWVNVNFLALIYYKIVWSGFGKVTLTYLYTYI